MSKSNQTKTNETNEKTYRRVHTTYPYEELQDDLIELFGELLADADLDHCYLDVEDDLLARLDRTDSIRKVGRNLNRAADRSEFEIEKWSRFRWLLSEEEGDL